MIDNILFKSRHSIYDFRNTACPDDPEKPRWDEWVDYYKLKRAFAAVIQPSSIVEIGVRYGYSARAFLDACPTASYCGIDDGTASWGGTGDHLEWARFHLPNSAEVFTRNVLTITDIAPCDLIHLDGPQDEIGWRHQISLGIGAAKWILIDGAFHAEGAHEAIHNHLSRYRDDIEWWSWMAQGYGQVLVKVKR